MDVYVSKLISCFPRGAIRDRCLYKMNILFMHNKNIEFYGNFPGTGVKNLAE